MDMLVNAPLLAEAGGYSIVWLLAGGSFMGAIVVFIIAKMLGK